MSENRKKNTDIAVDNHIVLGIFDDPLDALNSIVDVSTWPTNKDDVLS